MPKTLLLADDSVVIQKLVGLSFANEDVEIVTTDNGDDAVLRAREIRPDVVLADIVMPGKSGYEVCEAIKQDPDLGHVPVLLLTGTFEAFDEARAAASGADGQITKPFEAQALVERVTEMMSRPAAPTAPATEPPPIPAEASEYDFFDENVTTLNPADPATAEAIDPGRPTSEASGADISASMLFGEPGEAAAEDLEESAGDLALGQTVVQDVTPGSDARDEPPISMDDDLGLDDPISMPPPLPAAPVDLDAALDAAPIDDDATILVGDKDADTAPSLDARLSMPAASRPAKDETFVAESAVSTGGTSRTGSRSPAAVVTDLDEALGSRTAAPSTSSDPLDLDPEPLAASDLDFDFDVSEQTPAAEISDPLEQDPFSTLIASSDRSERDLLSDPFVEPSDDSIAAGYDVSSSELLAPDDIERDGEAVDLPTRPPSADPIDVLDTMERPAVAARAAQERGSQQPTPPARSEPVRPYGARRPTDAGEPSPGATASTDLEDFPLTPEPATTGESSNDPTVAAASWQAAAGDWAGATRDEHTAHARGGAGPELEAAEPTASPTSRAVIGTVSIGAPIRAGRDHLGTSAGASIEVDDAPAITSEPDEDAFAAQTPREDQESVGRIDEPTPVEATRDEPGEDRERIADLSPMMEQRVQETLEKVAWEAFSDLSESIVKQVMSRVEQIAWEVIPQMAETLVREEIRKMKGEDD